MPEKIQRFHGVAHDGIGPNHGGRGHQPWMGDFIKQLAGTVDTPNARIEGYKGTGDELVGDEAGFGDDGVELLGFE